MKGNYYLGDGKFEMRPLPQRPLGPGEVLIKVEACGICGTDVHIYHGSKGSAEVHPPVVLGHELAGQVVEVGGGVDRVAVGDHVTVDPNIYCGKCRFCRMGKKQMCQDLRAIGVTQNGGFADYCYVPQEQCYRLASQVPYRWGAMTEPVACCLHGMDRAGVRQGDTVCIIGGGAIGLIMLQLAQLAGAAQVVLSEPVEQRRELALSLGASAVVDPGREDLGQRLEELLGAVGADVVIECVGGVAAATQAVSAAARGGTVLLFGVPKSGTSVQLNLDDIFQKELKVMGSKINPDTHGRAAALINGGKLRLEPLITHSYPVERLEEGIQKQMADDSIKVVIEGCGI